MPFDEAEAYAPAASCHFSAARSASACLNGARGARRLPFILPSASYTGMDCPCLLDRKSDSAR